MNQELIKKEIDEVINTHGDFLGYLKDRWDDEKEYEDWSEYKKVLLEKFKDKDVKKVLKVGITYQFEGALITIKATARSLKASYRAA